MKLYERFGDSGFHSCITTSFGIDFDAFENIALPRLRGAGCSNSMLLVDGRMLTYALDGASQLPEYAGRHYTVTGIQPKTVFHPKIVLQLGRRSGRVIISSANMTASGLAGNLELAGWISCMQGAGGEARLIAATWQYLSGLLAEDGQALFHQLEWLRARTPWLLDTEPATEIVDLADGSAAALLTDIGNSAAAGIGTRFTNLIDGERVERLVVLSPYWDEDLAALGALVTRLAPKRLAILIDRNTELFPAEAAKALSGAEIFDANAFGKSRFIHAKAIIAETSHADHVLYGSANCTAAALGTSNYAGANHEACLYRRLPSGSTLASLGLAKIIEEGTAVRPDELPAYRREQELPLTEAALRASGQFECAFDTLYWRPPAAAPGQATIELLDAAENLLPIQLMPLTGSNSGHRQFRMSGAKARPAFGRLRLADGTTSALAVVSLVDSLREIIRDARGKKAESAAMALSEETEEGLWLWEVLNELEAAELAQQEEPGAKRPRKSNDKVEEAEEHRKLGYEAFTAGRQLRSDEQGAERNSLAGSDLSLVRNFLNRVLAFGDDERETPLPDEDAIARGLDLQDETGDGAAALEQGEAFALVPDAVDEAAAVEEQRRKATRAKATREQIVQAVAALNGRIKTKVKIGALGSIDVLRLRAMLMILAAAGQPAKAKGSSGSLQVLPLSNNADSWPRLIGRLLFGFFGGNRPPVWHLQIEAVHDKLPDDVFECWATSLWAVQACICAARQEKSMQPHTLSVLTKLAEHVYTRTALTAQELGGDTIATIFTKLSERFCVRLGIPSADVEQRHAHAIKSLRSTPPPA
ncbi:hypothetical protein [Aureimonas sp. SK2]|uniref:hypothetical protein n=1 Tax=Aureimonas sp. SK2 TaxID=3015992 RepID=UPI002444B5DC|nr:hypothetical protein [Aureimonas sp. SK2]